MNIIVAAILFTLGVFAAVLCVVGMVILYLLFLVYSEIEKGID